MELLDKADLLRFLNYKTASILLSKLSPDVPFHREIGVIVVS